MKNVRIGNDINIAWSILKKGEPFNLEGLKSKLYLKDMYGKRPINFTIQGNVIFLTFKGADQKHTGKYSLEFVINEGEHGMITTDACNFVNLVFCDCKADDEGDDISISTEFGFVAIIVDNELSETSENAVSNKPVAKAINSIPVQHGEGLNSIIQKGTFATASGENSVAFSNGQASGDSSFACGILAFARGLCSHAEGVSTFAENFVEHAQGCFNVSNKDSEDFGSDGNTIHSVGIGSSSERKNAHEIMQSGKHYILGVGGYDGTNPDKATDVATELTNLSKKVNNLPQGASMTSITYANLVSLRDSGGLVPGMQYRITDYVTTTTQGYTRSAGHQFDIIVTADNENTLNEVARACLHDGDTYFSQAGANLAAWKIWYCLDNDREKFVWASEHGKILVSCEFGSLDPHELDGKIVAAYDCGEDYEIMGEKVLYQIDLYNGSQLYLTGRNNIWDESEANIGWYNIVNAKGVIYRMIDEWNNDCPYDFKNVLFKRGLYASGGGLAEDEFDGDLVAGCYTFSWEEEESVIMDASIVGNNGNLLNDEGAISGVRDNAIGRATYSDYRENPLKAQQFLNNIVFLNAYGIEGRTFYGCYGNTFGNDCFDCSLDSYCLNNTFGNNCSRNKLKYSCCENSFATSVNDSHLGVGCNQNTFWQLTSENVLGDYCYNNLFEMGCRGNHLENLCVNNKFGLQCSRNTLRESVSGVALLNGIAGQDIDRSDIICAKNSNGSVISFYLGDLAAS